MNRNHEIPALFASANGTHQLQLRQASCENRRRRWLLAAVCLNFGHRRDEFSEEGERESSAKFSPKSKAGALIQRNSCCSCCPCLRTCRLPRQ